MITLARVKVPKIKAPLLLEVVAVFVLFFNAGLLLVVDFFYSVLLLLPKSNI